MSLFDVIWPEHRYVSLEIYLKVTLYVRRTKEQNNNHHVVEKISNLERERNQVPTL